MAEDAAQQEPLIALITAMLEQTPIKIEHLPGGRNHFLGSGVLMTIGLL